MEMTGDPALALLRELVDIYDRKPVLEHALAEPMERARKLLNPTGPTPNWSPEPIPEPDTWVTWRCAASSRTRAHLVATTIAGGVHMRCGRSVDTDDHVRAAESGETRCLSCLARRLDSTPE